MFVQRGARFIRLDAIAYIWKEVGTNCLHMENAHRIVQLFRLIFDAVAPHVQIITETNVPHEENISYFGNGYNEAQLVYNFSLPPLVLHAFYQKNTFTLTRWAKNLKVPSKRTSFFNFLASHDGIGVTPAKGLISESEIKALCERVKKLGGFVSYKDNPDGSRSPYELNINYLDALGDPNIEEEPNELIANRFLASQSIMIALKGVPGIYYHSLLGSRSWPEGTEETGCYRSINREKLDIEVIRKELRKEDSLRKQVFEGYLSMLRSRAFMSGDAFSPLGEQFIIDVDDRLFCVFREDTNQRSGVLCLTNVTPESVIGKIYKQVLPLKNAARWQTVLTRNANFDTFQEGLKLQIGAYGVLWLITRSS